MARTSNDFKLKTVEKVGVISENENSSLELRKTDVNGVVKYDLRSWYMKDGEERCNKGVRLTEDELLKLAEIIDDIGDFD